MLTRLTCVLLLFAGGAFGVPRAAAEAFTIRVVAANLTSGTQQSYSPDNGNHSNPEGAGARILKALQPDIVALQEFNTTIPTRQWVNETFGEDFSFSKEAGDGIPNGIVSRYPIVESGEWDDPVMTNRDFAWAKVALPNGQPLWVISVHLYSKKPAGRAEQARALVRCLANAEVPDDALVVLAGDFNSRTRDEACIAALADRFVTTGPFPTDPFGVENTNFNRSKPYDWVLASPALDLHEAEVKLDDRSFADGLVFDTRDFPTLERLAPVQPADSLAPQMQHMAVIRDFHFPDPPDDTAP